jgi:probable HAF family extracellular repeat protein
MAVTSGNALPAFSQRDQWCKQIPGCSPGTFATEREKYMFGKSPHDATQLASEPKANRAQCGPQRIVVSILISLCWLTLPTVEAWGQEGRTHLYTGKPAGRRIESQPQSGVTLPTESTNNKPRYKVIPIGPPPGRQSSFLTLSRSVNNEGTVAGYGYNGVSPEDLFLTSIPLFWRHGQLSELPMLDGWPGAFAFGVNDREQVVGAANKIDNNANIIQTAVLWDHGKVVNVGARFSGAVTSFASDVNNRGRVVGAYFDQNFTEIPFTLLNETIDLLPLLPGMTNAQPARINDLGEIVGQQFSDTEAVPCSWHPSGDGYIAVNLGTFGGTVGFAVGINDQGFTVGYSTISGDQHVQAFLWFGPLEDLGALQGDTDSLAYDINDRNQIVGLSGTATTTRTFLWENGHMMDLHDLVPTDTPPFNDSVGQINNRGEIPIVTMHADGTQAGFLLVPLDEK